MFQSSTVIRELVLSLAKVMLEHSVKLCPYRLCGGPAACPYIFVRFPDVCDITVG
jgi:hypothetical protein